MGGWFVLGGKVLISVAARACYHRRAERKGNQANPKPIPTYDMTIFAQRTIWAKPNLDIFALARLRSPSLQ